MSRFTRRYYCSLGGVIRHSPLYYRLQGWLHRTGRLLRQNLTFLWVVAGIALLLAVGFTLLVSSHYIEARLQADYGGLMTKLRLENSILRTEIDVLRGLRTDFVLASKQEKQEQQKQKEVHLSESETSGKEKEEEEEVLTGSSPLLKSAEE